MIIFHKNFFKNLEKKIKKKEIFIEKMLRQRKQFSKNALDLIKKRYFMKDPQTLNVIEDESDFFPRIARAIADVDLSYGKTQEEVDQFYYDILNGMDNHRFIPAGRTLAAAGGNIDLVPNCSVLPLEDSMDSIFQTLKDASLLQQAGVGIGFCFSALRPAGEIVKTAKSYSSGPISFLRVYNEAFRTIQQNNRHGATMGTFSVEHPDILDFITCKDKEGDINCFNISVLITDEFMETATNPDHPNYNKTWECRFGDKIYKPRTVKRDEKNKVIKIKERDYTARQIFDIIIKQAHKNGEPGAMFFDTINRFNPLPGLGPLMASNPCSEIALHPGDICLLLSMNVGEYVKIFSNGKKNIDFKLMEHDLRVLCRIGDNIVDLYKVPVELVAEQIKKNRRIGIGVMGTADMFIKLGIRYGSDESIQIIEEMMSMWKTVLFDESRKLALERGEFPNWTKSRPFLLGEPIQRNATLLTAAPTGSISRVFDVSSSIEPHFMFAYQSNIMNTTVKTFNPLLEQKLKELGLFENEQIIDQIVKTGSIQSIDEIPQDMKNIFVGAMDITPEDHVRVQAAFQKYIDNSISKTINYPEHATLEDIEKGYITAWKSGCKGFTVYRNNSRKFQVLETVDRNLEKSTQSEQKPDIDIEKLYQSFNNILQNNEEFTQMIDIQKIPKDVMINLFDSILKDYNSPQPTTPTCSSSSQSSSDNEEESVIIDIIASPSKRSSPFYCLECKGTRFNDAKCKVCMDCGWNPCGQ